MALVLTIETSTDVCSAALSKDGQLLCYRENSEGFSHAALLAVFIDELLKEAAVTPKQLSAVCVGRGPGSYTGLRIGVSTAKGICYAAELPLIAVDSLLLMCYGAMEMAKTRLGDSNSFLLCPMIDARRMEVYSALYDETFQLVDPVKAVIIEPSSFASFLEKGKVVFFGNGAAKCKEFIDHPNAIFLEGNYASAKNLITPALDAFKNSDFVDVAYFEPFYLKDFVITTSKKKYF
ncbi:tRNA (adenosine(37)-N6)-threonylcarbamoyltransferase complex dimerization subunit type 1 TsaB [Williamwhitmania taraxaci]|uniref:tRNA threonylcarbamoyladenosine biosynthesis protein TsaB n=1 Tax=Williamwhitmania taraxaci TaxID=1640674 RepID=A0A1G6H7R0_9BACT|nr:tRNA (adenosine(37)-N6)-threonylcarbamoyltransferase complex dimerization subunit type 1 TsaB [Williamwhitmania taraxaci]SDB90292.1 tRNA threonylcarbamoyladenosine biosynthesis protein TsaB [Williamwhitmania taraxaci]